METFNTTQIIIAVLSLFSGGALIKIIQGYWKEKKEQREGYHNNGIAFRKNLIKRLQALERDQKLSNQKIIQLTSENASLRTKLQQYHQENMILRDKINKLKSER